jgi:hypothetical protein
MPSYTDGSMVAPPAMQQQGGVHGFFMQWKEVFAVAGCGWQQYAIEAAAAASWHGDADSCIHLVGLTAEERCLEVK